MKKIPKLVFQTILDELEVGDVFQFVNDKKKTKETWIVRGNPFFNAGCFAKTRYCSNTKKEIAGKLCKREVIKLRDSKYKAKYQEKPINVLKGENDISLWK